MSHLLAVGGIVSNLGNLGYVHYPASSEPADAPSFLIQILKIGREAHDYPARGQLPQRPLAGSLAEYVKAVFASLCLI